MNTPLWSVMLPSQVLDYGTLHAETPLERALLEALDSSQDDVANAEQAQEHAEHYSEEVEAERDQLKTLAREALDLLQELIDYCNDPINERDPSARAQKLIEDNKRV